MTRTLLFIAFVYAVLALVHWLQPSPGDADVRGPVKTVQACEFPGR